MDESVTYGDEDFDVMSDPEGDAVAYGGVEQEVEEPAPERQQVAQPMIAQPTATPQGSDTVDPLLFERFKAIRKSLSALDGDDKVIDSMALGLAQTWHKELTGLKDEIRTTTEGMFFNTPEGQEVRQLMTRVPSLSKQSAIDLIRLSRENQRVTMERSKASGPKKPAGYQLSSHDRSVAHALKINEAEYAKELDDIRKGIGVDYSQVASGELIIENVM